MGTMYGRLLETQASRPKPTRASSLRHSPLRSLVISMKFRESRDLIFAACTDGVAEAMDVHRVQHSLEPSRISFQRSGPSPQTRSSELCSPQYIGFLRKARTETTARCYSSKITSSGIRMNCVPYL